MTTFSAGDFSPKPEISVLGRLDTGAKDKEGRPVFNPIDGTKKQKQRDNERNRNFFTLFTHPTQEQLSLAKHHDLLSRNTFLTSGGLYGFDPNNPNQPRKVNPLALNPGNHSLGDFLISSLTMALPFAGGILGQIANILGVTDFGGITNTRGAINKLTNSNVPPSIVSRFFSDLKKGYFDPNSPNFATNVKSFNNQLTGVGQLPASFKQQNVFDLAQTQDKRSGEERQADIISQLTSSNPKFGRPLYKVIRDMQNLNIKAPATDEAVALLGSDRPSTASGVNNVKFRTPSFDTITGRIPQIETKQLGRGGYANFFRGKRYDSNSEAAEARAKYMQRLYQAGRISDSGRIYTEPQLDLKTNLQRYGQAGNIGEEFNKGKETTPAPTVTLSKELSEQVAQTGKIPSKAEVLAARKQFLASLPSLTLPITNISSVAKKLLAS